MLRIVLAVLALTLPALSQDGATALPLTQAACGHDDVQFNTRRMEQGIPWGCRKRAKPWSM